MNHAHPFVIVGGGIAGLASALALAQVGCRIVLLEQSSEFKEIGAGIQLGPNGLRMLDRLGVLPAVGPLVVKPDDLIVMDGVTAEQVATIPTGAAFVKRFGYPYSLIHRADLHRVLLDACRSNPNIELLSGVTLAGFEDTEKGVWVQTIEQGRIQACALIGADGLWSRTRESIIGSGKPRVSGHIAYRSVLPMDAIEPQYRRHAMTLWAGPRNHLVHYPLRGGQLFNLVAVFHSDRYVEGWDRQGDAEELTARFAGNCETVRTLLAKVETWRMWVLCDREPDRLWSKGRAVLVGDAVHPMLQYLAQGAGMALEDAVVLGDCVKSGNGNFEQAFERFATIRHRRTARCQIMARIYGGFYHAENVTRELRNEYLASRSTESSYESLSWLYDFAAA
jgi:2-polyprenyl-6-methoxyphenol hydroxylase-like FAD-dependent oxidoreductase